MFMGVVARPRPDKNFDGRIFLERVSKNTTIGKLTAHTNFSDDVLINQQLKSGEWKSLYTDGMTVGKMKSEIIVHYDLSQEIGDRLEITYGSHTTGGKKKSSSY